MLEQIQSSQWKGGRERERKERQSGECSLVSYPRLLNSLIIGRIYYVRLYISKRTDILEREWAVLAIQLRLCNLSI